MKRVSITFGIYCTMTIFPSSVIISFQDSYQFNPSSSESYSFPISAGWNFCKLSLLDQLCYDIRDHTCEFDEAEKRLVSIETQSQS